MARRDGEGNRVRVTNELVQLRGRYAIHRYRFSDTPLCDYHVAGPGFRYAIFNVAEEAEAAAISEINAQIEAREATDSASIQGHARGK